MWTILPLPLFNTTDASSGAPAPDANLDNVNLPAGNEVAGDALNAFVLAAELGGEVDRAGNESFPDLPPTEAPAPAPTPAPAPLAPPSPPVVAPAQTPPVVAPPAAQPAAVPAPAPAPVAAPVAAPAPAPAPTAAQPPQAPGAEPAAAPAAPAPQAPAAQQPLDAFAAMAEQIKAVEGPLQERLAKELYQISPEDHEAFISGDTGKISALAARIHWNCVNSVLNSLSKLMPVAVNGLLEVNRASEEREKQFWEVNPHLRRADHKTHVMEVLRTYNQLNPNVSDEKRFKDVGLLVAQMHQIPLTQQAVPGQIPPPAAPVVRTPGPVVRQAGTPGFAPASASGAPSAPVQQDGPLNPWSEMVDFAQMTQKGAFDS